VIEGGHGLAGDLGGVVPPAQPDCRRVVRLALERRRADVERLFATVPDNKVIVVGAPT